MIFREEIRPDAMVAYTGVGFWRCRPTLVRQCETPQAVGRQPIQIPTLFPYTNLTPTRGVRRHEHFMENVFFEPWVGENYEIGGIFGKRILVLGESHYCGGCKNCGDSTNRGECAKFTTEKCIKPYLNGEAGRWGTTFKKFEQTLVEGEIDDNLRKAIWNSVIFYNYLQVSMTQPRQGGLWDDYRRSDDAFFEVLEKYRPQLIIAWGVSRLYYNMPGGDKWKDGEEKIIDNYSIRNGYYILRDNTEVRVIWIYHPSAGFSSEWWRQVVISEINSFNSQIFKS